MNNKIKTFFIYSIWDRHKDFIENMKMILLKKGWQESDILPVDFMFLYFTYKIEPPIIDTERSKFVNLIKGNTFDNILNNELFITKFKNEYFTYPYKFINKENIKNIIINKEYTIWPVSEKYISRKYNKKIVSSRKEIEDHFNLYPEYVKWMIRDNLTEPVLKNGHIFNLNFIFILKIINGKYNIYAIKNKKYIKTKLMYDRIGYNNNPNIYNSMQEEVDKNEIQLFFPEDRPDGWSVEETKYVNDLIENTISIIFKNKIDIKPDNNSKNAYFIFNAYIRLFEGLPPMIYYILNTFSPQLHMHIIPAIISIIIENKSHPDFKEIDYKKTMELKMNLSNNFEYTRFYSLGRSNNINVNNIFETFYVRMQEDDFEEELSEYLINQKYKISDEFPVDFILLSGYPSYYKNRFDSKGSNWISLLYGNSKTEITNKILLHKKYKNSDFILPAYYLNKDDNFNILLKGMNESVIKILKPLNGFSGDGIKVVKTINEVKDWIKLKDNEKYKEWLLENYVVDPDLKEGYKFHFRVLTLVKVKLGKPIEVFISNHKFYVKAIEKYKKEDWNNKNIHDTHYSRMKRITFPEELPDGWNNNDANKCINEMNNIVKKIFTGQTEFKPDWNAQNGFEIFGTDFIFSNKKTYLLEINSKTGIKGCNVVIPGLIETIIRGKENKYFTKLI
jgi:hypothetical protein